MNEWKAHVERILEVLNAGDEGWQTQFVGDSLVFFTAPDGLVLTFTDTGLDLPLGETADAAAVLVRQRAEEERS